jgi:hypothetical protein|tara:strand:+ start:229 stop:339 length:111 start_codon:yes stop_codon:yes gene_type:complete
MEKEEDNVGKQSNNNGSFSLSISLDADDKISETEEN